MTPQLTPDGIRVPGWAIGAITAAVTLIGAGVLVGQRVQQKLDYLDDVNTRLCRIERALQIEPWQTCPAPITQPRSRP